MRQLQLWQAINTPVFCWGEMCGTSKWKGNWFDFLVSLVTSWST